MNKIFLPSHLKKLQSSFTHLSIIILFFTLQFAATLQATAQQPDSLWTKIHGGIDYDRGHSMIPTSDGGFALIGETDGYREFGTRRQGKVWLVKTDSSGDTLWTKTYMGSDYDLGNAVRQTSDGGYILAGYTSVGPLITVDAWLIRTDAAGDTLWTRTYGTDSEESANDVIETADGGFVFTGFASSEISARDQDAWLVKTDSAGDTLWTGRYYSGDVENVGNKVLETDGGDFIVAGTTKVRGQVEDVFLFRTDENGNELWSKTYNKTDGLKNEVDNGRDIVELEDDGFMVLGFSKFSSWLLRTDAGGDTLWTKKLTVNGESFKQTVDGGYIITGGTWLERTDSAGDTQWSINELGGLSNSVEQTSDGGFVVSGYTLNYDNNRLEDLWIFRLGPEGLDNCIEDAMASDCAPGIPQLTGPVNDVIDVVLPVNLQWDSAANADKYSVQIASDIDFNKVVAEAVSISETEFEVDNLDAGSQYHWRVRSHGGGADSDWSTNWNFTVVSATSNQIRNEVPTVAALHQNYPNPFNPATMIGCDLPQMGDVRLEVFDMIGRRVALLIDNQMSAGRHQVRFDASRISSGIYIYRLQIDTGGEAGKIFMRKLTVIK